ncbi:hypothetical protein TNCV_1735531 [Trichonephila clavipes]|nr:hypothetical protein TNCV_1735531 [Trichonephila clavipes]
MHRVDCISPFIITENVLNILVCFQRSPQNVLAVDRDRLDVHAGPRGMYYVCKGQVLLSCHRAVYSESIMDGIYGGSSRESESSSSPEEMSAFLFLEEQPMRKGR